MKKIVKILGMIIISVLLLGGGVIAPVTAQGEVPVSLNAPERMIPLAWVLFVHGNWCLISKFKLWLSNGVTKVGRWYRNRTATYLSWHQSTSE